MKARLKARHAVPLPDAYRASTGCMPTQKARRAVLLHVTCHIPFPAVKKFAMIIIYENEKSQVIKNLEGLKGYVKIRVTCSWMDNILDVLITHGNLF